MFEDESKFCQNLKFFMTADISEISDIEYVLNNLKSQKYNILSLRMIFWIVIQLF